MNGKLFKWNKKQICLHKLFSKLHNYFSRKSPRTSLKFRQSCNNFFNPSFKKWCFVFETVPSLQTSLLRHNWSTGPLSVHLVLGTGGNHLEPDLGYTVDAAALKNTGVELHLLLLHLCEAWRCRVGEAFHFYSNPFDSSFQCSKSFNVTLRVYCCFFSKKLYNNTFRMKKRRLQWRQNLLAHLRQCRLSWFIKYLTFYTCDLFAWEQIVLWNPVLRNRQSFF
jgi:hypothetical protein